MVNSTVLSANFGVSAGAPTSMKLKITFSESAVDAAKGTSTVKAVVQLVNNSATTEHWYKHGDGRISVRVGTITQRFTGAAADFDVAKGGTRTVGTLSWTGVNHRTGTVAVALGANWPTGTGGSGLVGLTTGSLTLNNAPAPPTAPVWAGNAVPSGIGTGTTLNWTNKINVSPSGAAQISPYTGLNLLISQANYPDHFTPNILASDLGSQAFTGTGPKVTAGTSNYAVQTFWYTTLGPTLPSVVAFKTGVTNANVITVKPPSNPPKTAVGWGVAIARASGTTVDATKVTVQSVNGSPQIPLTKTFVASNYGITTTGGPPPSNSFGDEFAWSQNSVINMPAVNGVVPSTLNVATIGGFWYQFQLIALNNASPKGVYGTPQVYFAPGIAPDTGGGTSGDQGDGNVNVIYSPQMNVGVIARSLNLVNASCAVIPVVAQIIDFASPGTSLTESTAPVVISNYCSDPRAYWLTASTAGNNTASPYVAEASAAGYTSHNAQQLPAQMYYALQALNLGEVDRGHTQTFVAANNNTGSTVSHYVYVGGNPDAGNTAASLAVPAGATSVQISAMAWVNSANAATGRTVTPYNAIRFSAMYANGTVIATNTQAISAVTVNTLNQISASYTLPASTGRVSAAFVSNTAAGANWNGGYQAGDSVTTTGFMMLFNQQPNTPYFDGGYPFQPGAAYELRKSADLGFVAALTNITQTRQSSANANMTGLANPNQKGISSWTPAVVAPLATYPDSYPYQGWTQSWTGSAASQSGYGGWSDLTAPQLLQYASGTQNDKIWTDQSSSLGNIMAMSFDGAAQAVIAGDQSLTNLAGGLTSLLAGVTYSVNTNVYCPAWAGGNLAQFKLVTNTVTGSSGATTTTSTPIAANGPMSWTFTVPAGAVTAYLAVVALPSNPRQVVRFSKPAINAAMGANTAALGYLGGANAVPLRVNQVKMPAYYRKAGWPTPASYLFKDTSKLSFIPSALAGTVGQPTVVDPRSVSTTAAARFLASQGYSQAAGTWSKYSGTSAFTFHAGSAPYYAASDDTSAYSYQLSEGQQVSIPSLLFTPGDGTYLYSDDLVGAGVPEFTMLLVLGLNNTYNGLGGLVSTAPQAAGGGPDTDGDFTSINYVSGDMVGGSIQTRAATNPPKTTTIGDGVRVHKPIYLAMRFSPSITQVFYATDPASVNVSSQSTSLALGQMAGSLVLGADAGNGLAFGAFNLFEMGIYPVAVSVAQIRHDIQVLGQVYG